MIVVVGVIPTLAALACIPAFIAHSKGHSFGLWWVGGFLLWPFALIEALTLRRAGEVREERPALVQTWRPFIALCSLFVMAIAVLAVYELALR